MTRFGILLGVLLVVFAGPSGLSSAGAQEEPEVQADADGSTAGPDNPPTPTGGDDDSKLPEDELKLQEPSVRAELEQRLKALDNAGLNADDKQKTVALYQQALESFDVANQQISAALEFQTQLDGLPEGIKEYAAKLANPLKPYDDVSGLPLEKVEERAKLVETQLAKYRQQLVEMIAAPKFRSQRMAELPKQLAEVQQKLKQASDELTALGSEDVADAVVVARRAALTQSDAAYKATLQALEREQRLYEQGGEWVKLRRDYFARYVPYKEKRLAQLRQDINRRREFAAQQQARQAAAAAEEVHAAKAVQPKAISVLATNNQELAEQRAALAQDITVVSKQLDAARNELLTLNDQFTRAKKQDEVDELSHLNGQLLRDQQSKLPNLRTLRRSNALRESARAESLLRLYDLNDQRSELADVEDLANRIASRLGDLSDEVRTQILELLKAKREILEPFIKDCDKYSSNLAELHIVQSELISTTEAYAAFIAERVLWIRSCSVLSPADWRPAAGAVAWSFDPRNWRDAAQAIVQAGSRQPGQFTMLALGFAVLAAGRGPARRRLRQLGEEADKRSCTRLRPTIHALWLTAVIASPWPALLALLGWSMDALSESEFVRSLSVAIRFTAVCLLLLELSRHLCRRGGLADCHFDWPDACISHVRRRLRWLTVLGLPLVLWLVGLEVQQEEPLWSSSLGRVCFMAVMLLLAAAHYRLLLARNSPFRQIALVGGGGWLTPLELSWRPAAVLLPAALAVLAAIGYYFTALQAAVRVTETAAMLLAVLALGGVTRRWLLVNRRRLAREQAKQRRAQMAAAAEADPTAPPAAELVEEAIDLAAISEQTQKLVRTFLAIITAVGLVVIWKEILPALKYPAARTLPGAELLTWGDLVAFVLVLAVTYISVRDIPALLELVVLQHLPLDSGSRYAVTSLCRYVLTAIGLTAAFNSIGGEWNKIQWLVAAMSVGLGFGLQEIFANFVSGVILLFERPIRVGDIVTLGDKTGVVNRIRMRATTIVDWDRKEYIVPNKDLVTERLLNWTLSDQMNRIEIFLTVAHGADTELACGLLLDAAREQPHILAEPAPNSAFEGYTESGLKLALRCFLPTLEHRGTTIHQLYTTIDRRFRSAGIEVAATPREMRVRMLREGGRFVRGAASQAAFEGQGEAA